MTLPDQLHAADQERKEGSGPCLYRRETGITPEDGHRVLEVVQWTDDPARGAIVIASGHTSLRFECFAMMLSAAECLQLARALLSGAGFEIRAGMLVEVPEPAGAVCACGLQHGHAGICQDDPNDFEREGEMLNDGEPARNLSEDDPRVER